MLFDIFFYAISGSRDDRLYRRLFFLPLALGF
jgi:hypothetical protein